MKQTFQATHTFHLIVLSLTASLVLIASPAISQEALQLSDLLKQAITPMSMGVNGLGANRSSEDDKAAQLDREGLMKLRQKLGKK